MTTPKEELLVEIGIGDARVADRLHVVDLLCSVGKRCSGRVVDISEQGVRVNYTGSKRYNVGDFIGIALRRHDVLILAKTQVMWIREPQFNEHLAGLRFEQLKEEDLAAIRELMSNPDQSARITKSA